MPEISDAAIAFDKELERLGVRPDETLARRAARVVAGASVWERTIGPLLSSGEVQDLLGISREAIRQRVASGALLALPTDHPSRRAYPAFQFEGRRVVPGLDEVLSQFFTMDHGPGRASVSPHTVASWLTTPQTALDGRTPASALRTSKHRATVLRLARQAAARLAR